MARSEFVAGRSPDSAALQANWRRWLFGFGASLGLVLLAMAAALVLLDPYDTGRLPSVLGRGVASQSPRVVRASQARNPTFDGAIIGNSHLQLLSPARLKAATGVSFVSLTVPGSGIGEQLSLLGWFLLHRREPPRALVFGIDDFACHDGRGLLQVNPFPFWLYDPSVLRYAAGLFNTVALGHAGERLLFRLSGRLSDPGNGYDDYERGRTWKPWRPAAAPPPSSSPALDQPDIRFEGLERIEAAVTALSSDTRVVFVASPVHVSGRPAAGSARDSTLRRCMAAVATFAAVRRNTAFLDYLTDDPTWADEAAFWDSTHIRRPAAERIEGDIARTLHDLGATR